MCWIIWEALVMELASVTGQSKQFNSVDQCLNTFGGTSRAALQPSQIMA
ncbi:hypothetical protein HC928_21995 [bacterium]|nr:hypothetical protein [bacterium]